MYQTFLRGTVPRGPFRRGHLCLFIRACSLVRVLGSVFLYAFDLIELNGDDLRREPLETHKATLASLLLPGLRLNEHLAHDGESVFRHVCKMGLRGHRVEAARLALPLRPVANAGGLSCAYRARPPEALRLRHHGEYKRAIASQGEGMKIQRRTLLAAGQTGMAWTATQGLAAASSTRTRFVFHVSSTWGSLLDWLVDRGYAPITAELEKRGFPSMLVHSSVRGSDTPNEDRASAVVKALQNVTDDVVIVGISNQGNFLPLVAAARPIRRVVYVNALIPRPGKAFIEVCQTEQVAVPGSYLDKLLRASQSITDDFLKLIHNPNATKAQLKAMQERIDASSSAHTMVGFYEVCPLKALPKVDNVYVSGSADDQIRPEWEQSAARRVLGVEPVVISGAGHANIFTNAKYAAQLADACVKGL